MRNNKNIFIRLGAFLVCLIFCIGFINPCDIKPSADAVNLARNPGFENGNSSEAESWGLWPGWNTGSYISTDTVHGGNRAIKVELKQNQNYALYAGGYTNSDFNLGEALTVWMWVKYENLIGGFSFGLERKHNNTAVANSLSEYYTGSSDGWMRVKYDVPETELALSEDIIKIEIAMGSGTLYIDDIELLPTSQASNPPENPDNPPVDTETEYILNGDLEQGSSSEVSSWGLSSGWTASKIDSDAFSGTRAVKMILNLSDTNLFQSSAWNPAQYDLAALRKVTAQIKCTDVTGNGVYLRVEQKRNGVTVSDIKSDAVIGSTSGWQQIELIIPKREDSITELVISVVGGAGSGTVLIDSISMKNYVEETPPPNPNPNPEPNPEEKPEEQNQLLNGSFEDGQNDAPGWGLTSGWNQNCFSSEFKNGSRSVIMTATDSEVTLFQSNKWNPDAAYSLSSAKRITAWVKTDNLKGAGISLRIERKADDRGVADVLGDGITDTRGEWVKITLIVPETKEKIDEIIVSVVCGAGSGKAYIDDIVMEEYVPKNDSEPIIPEPVKDKNLLLNGGFELGSANEASGWGIGSGWHARYITSDTKSGGRAIKIVQGKDAINLFQSNKWNTETYDINTAKKITAWVNYSGVTDTGVFLLTERKKDEKILSTSSSTAVNGTSNGWVMLELIMPPISEKADELVVSLVCSKGSGTVIIDDVVMTEYTGKLPQTVIAESEDDGKLLLNGGLEKLNSDGSVYAWDVWPGDPAEGEKFASISSDVKHGGNQSLCITLTQKNVQAVYQYTLLDAARFDFQGAYVFSAWVNFEKISLDSGNTIRIGVKRKGTDGNYYNAYNELDTSIEGWHEVKIVVPKALVEISQYDVIFEIGMGSGNFYMDDMLLNLATAEDLATLKTDGDTSQKLSASVKLVSSNAAKPLESENRLPTAAVVLSGLAIVSLAFAVTSILMFLKLKKQL